MTDPSSYEPKKAPSVIYEMCGGTALIWALMDSSEHRQIITQNVTVPCSILAGFVIRNGGTDPVQIVYGQVAKTTNGSRAIIAALRE